MGRCGGGWQRAHRSVDAKAGGGRVEADAEPTPFRRLATRDGTPRELPRPLPLHARAADNRVARGRRAARRAEDAARNAGGRKIVVARAMAALLSDLWSTA